MGKVYSKKQHFQAVGLIIALAIVLTSPLRGVAAEEEVVLQLRWHHQFQFAGYYAAVAKGFYARAGLKVTLVQGSGKIDTVDEVVSGRAHYGVTNAEVLLHYLNGRPLVVLASIFQHSPLVLIARTETGITHPQQMIGRPIRMTRHSRDLELHAMFHNEGIEIGKLDIIEGNNTIEDYLKPDYHVLSAYITNEPFFWQQKGVPFTVIKPITYGIDFYGDCLFTSRQELSAHPARVKAFRQASLEGWAYAMANIEEIVDLILARYPDIQKSRDHLLYEARAMRDLILPDLVEIGHNNPGRWQHIARTFQKFGMIPDTAPALSRFVYDDNPRVIDRWVRRNLALLIAIAASILLIIGTLAVMNQKLKREVNVRKSSELALNQSREKYVELFDNIGSGVAVYESVDDGADFIFRDLNRAGEKIEGVIRDAMMGRRVTNVSPIIKETGLLDIFSRVWRTGIPEQQSACLYSRQNEPQAWRANYVYKLSSGEIVSVFDDVSPLKESRIELEQSEQRYRTLFENSPISLWEVDFSKTLAFLRSLPCTTEEAYLNHFDTSPLDMWNALELITVIDINQATVDLYEAADKADLLDRLSEIVLPKYAVALAKKELAALAQGRMFRVECDTRTLKGRNIHVGARSSVAPEFETDLGRIFISVHDLTERATAEEEKRHLESQLRQAQKMEALGTLAGGIAHDFNNILVAIIGYAELALMDTGPDSKMASKLIQIRQAGNRASKLVKQILAFGRKSEQLFLPVHLPKIIKEALRLLRSSLPANIEITNRIDQGVDDIMGDPTQIHQIILNICTNAGQSLEAKGGAIEITLAPMDITPLAADAPMELSDGPHLVLAIRDDGPGIDPSIIDHIFDPYFTTKPKGEGTGLGLSVVHGIVKTHGGAIRVHSQPGHGASFKIYLPTTAQSETAAEAKRQVEPGGNETILIVDDEPAIVGLLKEMLERLKYRVVPFTDSPKALAAFKADPERIDLIITDMTMPKLTGDQLAREILKVRADTPVILCTGYSKHLSRKKARDLGAKAFVAKPLELNELSRTIRRALTDEQ